MEPWTLCLFSHCYFILLSDIYFRIWRKIWIMTTLFFTLLTVLNSKLWLILRPQIIPTAQIIPSAVCLIVLAIAASHPNISVSELRRDSVLADTLTDNLYSLSWPSRLCLIHAAVFPQRVCHIPASTVQHTAIFNRGRGSQREELQLPLWNLAEIWPFGTSFSPLLHFS